MARKKVRVEEDGNVIDESQSNTEEGTMEPEKKQTIRQYWIEVLTAHPSWLHKRSNDELFDEYLKDHPGESEVPKSAKQGLSTVKSQMRKEFKERKRGRKASAVPTENGTSAPATSPATATRTRGKGVSALEKLEEQIDDVLTLAKSTEGAELRQVVQLLKAARNAVIVLLHQG